MSVTGSIPQLTSPAQHHISISAASACSDPNGAHRFFPLFFKNDCQMSPAQVQTIYLFVPLAIASLSSIGTRCAGLLGRIQTVLLLRLIGLAHLLAIIILYHFNVNKWLIVAVYVIRTAFMNCTYPLEEGIIMDYVPKAQRARFTSVPLSLPSSSVPLLCPSA